MRIEFQKDGTSYTVEQIDPGWCRYNLLYRGKTFTFSSDMDLFHEFGQDAVAWHEYLMEDTDLFVYSDILEDYCLANEQEDLEHEIVQEWGRAAEHERQESRTDIFL